MANPLDAFRKQIDSIDQQIHDLLMERAELVLKIGEEKRKSGAQMIQPDREAMVIRRLMDRHKGSLQRFAVVRIWRELVSAVSILQTDMKVAVYAPSGQGSEYTDMVRDYFGSVMPVQYVGNPLLAVSMVRDDDVTFAVVPWPENEEEKPWWAYLSGQDDMNTMRIMVRLPYTDRRPAQGHHEYRALVIAKLKFNNSGNDHSFLMLDIEHGISRARIVDKLKALGITAVGIYSQRAHGLTDRSLHLIEIDSFIAADDARLGQLIEKLESSEGRCAVIGGYPILPRIDLNN